MPSSSWIRILKTWGPSPGINKDEEKSSSIAELKLPSKAINGLAKPVPGSVFQKYSALTILKFLDTDWSSKTTTRLKTGLHSPLTSLTLIPKVWIPFKGVNELDIAYSRASSYAPLNAINAVAFPSPGSVSQKYSASDINKSLVWDGVEKSIILLNVELQVPSSSWIRILKTWGPSPGGFNVSNEKICSSIWSKLPSTGAKEIALPIPGSIFQKYSALLIFLFIWEKEKVDNIRLHIINNLIFFKFI